MPTPGGPVQRRIYKVTGLGDTPIRATYVDGRHFIIKYFFSIVFFFSSRNSLLQWLLNRLSSFKLHTAFRYSLKTDLFGKKKKLTEMNKIYRYLNNFLLPLGNEPLTSEIEDYYNSLSIFAFGKRNSTVNFDAHEIWTFDVNRWCWIIDSSTFFHRFIPGDNAPRTSVGQYYRDVKNYNIRYPELPLLVLGTQGALVPIEVSFTCASQVHCVIVISFQHWRIELIFSCARLSVIKRLWENWTSVKLPIWFERLLDRHTSEEKRLTIVYVTLHNFSDL